MDGSGYVELATRLTDHAPDIRMDMKIEFSTWAEEGLIVWQGTNDFFGSNFMAVGSKLGKKT